MKKIYFLVFLVLLYSSICLAEEVNRARVVDKDRPHIGVKSKIRVKNVEGITRLVSQTDAQGYVKVDYECKELEFAIFLPENDSYYSENIECPITINPIYLTSINYSTYLIANAERKLSESDYGAAALALTEAAARLRKINSLEANKIEKKAFNATGLLLKVNLSSTFDLKQNKYVMTRELKKAVIKQQKKIGLKTSGKLNYLTLKSLSGTSLSTMLFSVEE